MAKPRSTAQKKPKRGPVHLWMSFTLAIYGGKLDDIREIIGEDPDILTRDDRGATPLHTAVMHGKAHTHVVRFFLDGGVPIDAQDNDGLTALMFTAMHAERDAMAVLLEKGARTDLTDKRGRMAAEVAEDCDHPDVARFLREYAQGKIDKAEAERQRSINDDAARAHQGLDRTIAVGKPLAMRARPRSRRSGP